MSAVPKQGSPIQIEGLKTRAPVSELQLQQMGGAINYLLGFGWKAKSFTSTQSVTLPSDVGPFMFVDYWGGGGGGGGAGSINTVMGSGGGGSGGGHVFATTNVTPSQVSTITIGAGGAAGAIANIGGSGGATSGFGVTALGGLGGIQGNNDPSSVAAALGGNSAHGMFGQGYPAAGGNSGTGQPATNGNAGDSTMYAAGGAAGPGNNPGSGGGGGGGAGIGPGGKGGTGGTGGGTLPGITAAANSGGGGGGGPGNISGGSQGAAGAGGSGFATIYYFSAFTI